VTARSAAPAPRRPRRHEPNRRDRLIATTLDVVAEVGVARASLRAVARAADVPLGSLTYHFSSHEQLLATALTAYVETMAARLDERMRAATDAAGAVEQLAEHLVAGVRHADLVIAVELYVAAARHPALRAVTEDWMARSRRSLELHFDPVTARQLDALVEGLLLHGALSTDPMDHAEIRAALRRLAT
jgi:DNA-binding transcriptional regulator YbjK